MLLLGTLCLGACGDRPAKSRVETPSWFALEHAAVEGDTRLVLDPYPTWFHGPPKLVSSAEIARERREAEIVVLDAVSEEDAAPPGMTWIPTSPPLPAYLDGIRRSQQGAKLGLQASLISGSGDLELRVTLHATVRSLWREVEHRAANAYPFLLGIYADGAPVMRRHLCSAKSGGVSRFHEVVGAGDTRTWVLVVQRESVQSLLGATSPQALGLVVVFSERQHDSTTLSEGVRPAPDLGVKPPFGTKQFVIRSEIATVRWQR